MKSFFSGNRSSKFDVAIECLWLIVIFIIPLYFNPLTLHAFYFVKSLALVLLVSLMLGLCFAQLIIYPRRIGISAIVQYIKSSPLQVAAVIFGLIWIISASFSIMPYKSIWGNLAGTLGLLPNLSWVIFFIILTLKIGSREQIFRVLYTLVISAGLVSFIGILQYIDPHVLPWFRFEERVYSTDGNPLSLSAFLAMILPVTLALIIMSWYGSRSQGKNKVVFAGLMLLFALQLGCLVLAQYSLTLLLFIVGIFSFFALIGYFLQKKATIALSIVFLLVIVVVAGVLLGPMLLSVDSVVDVGNQASAVAAAEQVGLPTLSIRVDAWKCAANVILQSPEIPYYQDNYHWLRRIIGYGPETFIAVSQLRFPASLRSHDTFESLVIAQPQNHYLYLGATIGILGLLSFLSIMFIFFLIGFKSLMRSKDRETIILFSAFISAVFQYCVHIIFNASVICPELVLWTVMGLTVALGKMKNVGSEEMADTPDQLPVQRTAVTKNTAGLVRKSLATVVILVSAATGFYLTLPPLMANMKIQSGLQIVNKDKGAALAFYQEATKIEPRQSYYFNFVGNLAYIMAMGKDYVQDKQGLMGISEAAYLKAIAQEPQMAIWHYRLADIYVSWVNIGDKSKLADALALYEKADRLFPGNAVILNKWAFALIINGDYAAAGMKLDEAERNDPAWVQTRYFKGFLQASTGDIGGAGKLFLAVTDDTFNEIRYFINYCGTIAGTGKASLVRDSLKTQLDDGHGEWTAFAFLAVADVYSGNLEEAVSAFQQSATLVPDKSKYILGGTIRAMLGGNNDYKKAGQEIIDNLINKTAN
ncbi:MAG: hypothetical protein EHM12_00025 [Dehalococcoidia bacterium]|nr:MAG: hypothetical protein EHM12_00025 [Dehalococcoidia bacterium]